MQYSLGKLNSFVPHMITKFPPDHVTPHLFDVFQAIELTSVERGAPDTLHLLFDFTAQATMVTTRLSQTTDKTQRFSFKDHLHGSMNTHRKSES